MFHLQNKITLENKTFLQQYLNGFEYQCSGSSFSSLYMWRESNHFSWQMAGEYLCMASLSHLEMGTESWFCHMPFTKTGSYDTDMLRESILEIKSVFEQNGLPFVLRLVPVHMVGILEEAFPGQLVIRDDRPNYDYIYSLKELVELKGRAFHPKKNYVNSFRKNFEYEFTGLTSKDTDECMAFIRAFNDKKELPEHEMMLLKMEEDAMEDVFRSIENINMLAGAIRIGGKLEALTIGGFLGKDTVTCHVEKANTDFRGLYPAITNEFCKYIAETAPHITKINREEDMGIPGLRKAKLSYNPIKLLEKYIITWK